MTSIDRTIYRHVKQNYITKELIEAYTPTEEERRLVDAMTRTAQHQLNLCSGSSCFRVWAIFPPWTKFFPPLLSI